MKNGVVDFQFLFVAWLVRHSSKGSAGFVAILVGNGRHERGFWSRLSFRILEAIDERVDVAFGSFRHVKVLRVGIIGFLVLAL